VSKRSNQERRLCARYSDAMRLFNTCRIDGWWVSALRMLGILPPTLPETSPNFPQRAVLSPGKPHRSCCSAHQVLAHMQRRSAPSNEEPLYLQATGFVLRPNGTVAVAVYSGGTIDRLVAAATINFLK
jgi:hypothetical protein